MVAEMDMNAVSSLTRLLYQLGDRLSVPRDQIIYAFCLFVAFLLAFLFRLILPPQRTSPMVRHAFMLCVGAVLSIYCFGLLQFSILLGLMVVCYTMMKYIGNNYMHIMVLFAALGMLASTHIYNMVVSYGRYNADFTTPLMIIVMKITGLAFALRDGRLLVLMEKYPAKYIDFKKLTTDQVQQCVRTLPNLLEYFSFLFSFVALFSGPLSSFTDYNKFITGENLPEKVMRGLERAPSPLIPTLKKFFGSLIALAINIFLTPTLSLDNLLKEDFISQFPVAVNVVYGWASGVVFRCRYYFAFVIADATCNAAGFGFNGFDKQGKARWDLATHMRPFSVELATSPKSAIDNWNIHTNTWLRRVCYERAPWQPRIFTFLLSAIWHGFYGGYLISFFCMALLTDVALKARRLFRDYFRQTVWSGYVYDVITCVGTCTLNMYMMFPFMVLRTHYGLFVWRSWYFFGHILIAPLLFYPVKKKTKKSEAKEVEKME